MRYLVTGGAGFIGSNLAVELERRGHSVLIADNFSSGHRDNICDFEGQVLDIDLSRPWKISGPLDAIFHQAAITDPRFTDDRETIRQNLEGFQRALDLARKRMAKLVYASTASLYGNGPAPQREDQIKALFSAYAESKLMIDEMAAHHFSQSHVVGLRYFNVFGPREKHKGRPASMVYHLSQQMKSGKRPRIFTGGEQKRDHIYVKDCVEANIKALSAPSGIYNVGTGTATSFNRLVRVLNQALGTAWDPEYFAMPYDPATYQNHTQADTTRARKYLDFTAAHTLETGIADYMAWMTRTEA